MQTINMDAKMEDIRTYYPTIAGTENYFGLESWKSQMVKPPIIELIM